eukprot:gene17873-24264_t
MQQLSPRQRLELLRLKSEIRAHLTQCADIGLKPKSWASLQRTDFRQQPTQAYADIHEPPSAYHLRPTGSINESHAKVDNYDRSEAVTGSRAGRAAEHGSFAFGAPVLSGGAARLAGEDRVAAQMELSMAWEVKHEIYELRQQLSNAIAKERQTAVQLETYQSLLAARAGDCQELQAEQADLESVSREQERHIRELSCAQQCLKREVDELTLSRDREARSKQEAEQQNIVLQNRLQQLQTGFLENALAATETGWRRQSRESTSTAVALPDADRLNPLSKKTCHCSIPGPKNNLTATRAEISSLTKQRNALNQQVQELTNHLEEARASAKASAGQKAKLQAELQRSRGQMDSKLHALHLRLEAMVEEERKLTKELRKKDLYTIKLERTVMQMSSKLQAAQAAAQAPSRKSQTAKPQVCRAPLSTSNPFDPGLDGNLGWSTLELDSDTQDRDTCKGWGGPRSQDGRHAAEKGSKTSDVIYEQVEDIMTVEHSLQALKNLSSSSPGFISTPQLHMGSAGARITPCPALPVNLIY